MRSGRHRGGLLTSRRSLAEQERQTLSPSKRWTLKLTLETKLEARGPAPEGLRADGLSGSLTRGWIVGTRATKLSNYWEKHKTRTWCKVRAEHGTWPREDARTLMDTQLCCSALERLALSIPTHRSSSLDDDPRTQGSPSPSNPGSSTKNSAADPLSWASAPGRARLR